MSKTLEARRTTFRPHGEDFVRITSNGCVIETDMRMLRKVASCNVDVCGDVQRRHFQPLRLDGRLVWAETVTGSLYDPETGEGPSSQLRLIKEPK
jgi:hypothetical protein